MKVTALSELLVKARGDRNVDKLIEDAEARGHVIDRGTIYRALAGDHSKRPREKTLTAFAEVFGLDVRKVREAADRPAGEREPWVPTPEAAQLSREQRSALNRLIKTIVQAEQVAQPIPIRPQQPKFTERQRKILDGVEAEAARRKRSKGKALENQQAADATAPDAPPGEEPA